MVRSVKIGDTRYFFGAGIGIVVLITLGAAPAAWAGHELGWFVISLGLSVLVLAPWLARRQIQSIITATLPVTLTVHAGKTVTATLRVSARRRAKMLLLSLAGADELQAAKDRAPRLSLTAIDGRAEGHPLPMPVRVRARGRYTALQLSVTSNYPFGIVTAQCSMTLGVEVTAFPRLASERDLHTERALRLITGQAEEARRRRASRGQGLPSGLRNARHGDTLRDLHWRSSLRRSRWTAVERPHPTHDLASLTLYLPSAADLTKPPTARALEAAISVAASIIQRWTSTGWDVDLGVVHSPAIAGAGQGAERQALCRSKNPLHHLRSLTDLTVAPRAGTRSRRSSLDARRSTSEPGIRVDVVPTASVVTGRTGFNSGEAGSVLLVWVDGFARTLVEGDGPAHSLSSALNNRHSLTAPSPPRPVQPSPGQGSQGAAR